MANNRLTTRIILRNDSNSGWEAVADSAGYKLLKGEVGVEFIYANEDDLIPSKTKIKIGDGQRVWKDLPYFGGDECHVFEAIISKVTDSENRSDKHIDAIMDIVGSTQLNKGDIAIVKEALIDDIDADLKAKLDAGTLKQSYQFTAYVYGDTSTGTAWKAMDGNYSASNVYFDDDFIFTTNIGTVTDVTSSKTVEAAGKSVKQFFSGLFAKEKHVTSADITSSDHPKVTITLTGAGDYEVGTPVSPSYTTSFADGKYIYGPEPTGVTVTSYEVSSTDGESWDTAEGTCKSFTVADGENYSVTVKANHTDGNLALSNIGNPGTYKFDAGSKTATSSKITGYRAQFYSANITPVALSSDTIRAMVGKVKPGNTFTGKYGSGNGFKITVPEGCKQVVIALYGKSLKNVFDNAAFGTDIVSNFIEVSANAGNEIAVEGAYDYTAVNYKVYVYEPDAALGANTYDCIIGQ